MRSFVGWTLVCLLFPGGSWAEERVLRGQVVFEGSHGEHWGAEGVTVSLVAGGSSDVTTTDGSFLLYLNKRFVPGTPARLSVTKKGWRLYKPVDGDIHIPKDLDTELIIITLVPTDSKKFSSE